MSTVLDRPAVGTWAAEDDNDERYEIIDGNRVELPPMSVDNAILAGRLARRMSNFAEPAGIGEAHTEALVKLPLPVDRNRRPDLFFVPFARWPQARPIPRVNAWEVLPDLCAEFVSPNDLAEEVREKVAEYLAAGVRVVWVLYPELGLADVYQPGGGCQFLTRADELDGGPVLPGFRLPLAELFPPVS